ncbi:MAG: TrkH family potassium uptake protein [Planctomycetota bacterium]|nr:MAG: TrkH family potassium uptake protein [Planctomycetota bacterium]
MNIRYVVKQLGLLLLALSAALLAVAIVFYVIEALLRHDVEPTARWAIFVSGLVGAAIGTGLWLLGGKKAGRHLGRKEALLLVAFSWMAGAAFAALPYLLWAHWPGTDAAADHPFRNFADCYFEAMSGLTTTGATILTDIEAVPRSLLLWRAFTQWIGGIGIVVLFVAVLPSLGVGGKRLFQIEAPGPASEGLQPQIRQTARVLLYIYLGLTAVQILALLIAGMTLFDSVCHTFTTIATAGFSTRNGSIGAFDSRAIEIVLVVFMVLAGVNFGLYFALLRRRYGTVLRDPELRTYLILLVGGATVISLCLLRQSMTLVTGDAIPVGTGSAIRYGVFTTASIATTTGYTTANFDTWPFAAKATLVLLMFVGGSAGSTAGGIKVIRIWIAFKVMLAEIEHVFRPNVVRPVRVGRTVLDDQLKLGTITYVLGILLLFAVGSLGVMILEQFNTDTTCDYATAAAASLSSLCTIGPGFAGVGPADNYGWMTPWTKMLLSLWMALGRLEVFALIVLLTPRFWRED